MDKEAINALAEKFGIPVTELFNRLVAEQIQLGYYNLVLGAVCLVITMASIGLFVLFIRKADKAGFESEGMWIVGVALCAFAALCFFIIGMVSIGNGWSGLVAPQTKVIDKIL